MTKAPDWHGLVAWDLLFNNLTTGLFLVAALGELAAPAVFTPVAQRGLSDRPRLPARRPAVPGARPGRPAAFPSHAPGVQAQLAHVARHLVSDDLLAAADRDRGAELLTARLLPDGATVVDWVRRLAVVVGLVPALGSAVYKGVLFSTSSQPGWKDARWLGGYLTNSASCSAAPGCSPCRS